MKDKSGIGWPLIIIGILVIIILVMITIATYDKSQSCIGSSQLGLVEKTTLNVRADGYYQPDDSKRNDNLYLGQWINSNIEVNTNQQLIIDIVGSVSYCSLSTKIDFLPTWPFNDTNIMINNGELVSLSIIPGLTPNKVNMGSDIVQNRECSDNEGYQNCWGTQGMGVKVKIGQQVLNNYQKRWGLLQYNDQQGPSDSSQVTFYNNNTAVGLYLKSTNSGTLNFEAIDSCGPPYDCFKNNQGGYSFQLDIERCVVENSTNVGSQNEGAVAMLISSIDPNNNIVDTTKATLLTSDNYIGNAQSSGTIWLKVVDTANNYHDNRGQYTVSIQKLNNLLYPSDEVSMNASNLLNKVIDPIKKNLAAVRLVIYNNLAADSKFHKIIFAAINLYLIIYAIFFTFGLTKIHQTDLIIRIFKLGLLFNLINSEVSWNFFNNYLFKLFDDGGATLIKFILVDNNENSNQSIDSYLFRFIDETIGYFFTKYIILKLLAMLLHPVGWIYAVFVLYSMLMFTIVIIKVIITYVLSFVGIGLLIALAPIFIVCILFEKTKELFNNWWHHLVNFTLQPVILFACFFIIYKIVIIALFNTMSFTACWKCIIQVSSVFGISIPPFCLMAFYTLQDTDIIKLLPNIVIFFILATLINQITELADNITGYLTQVFRVSFQTVTNSIVNDAKNIANTVTGQNYQNQGSSSQQDHSKVDQKEAEEVPKTEDKLPDIPK